MTRIEFASRFRYIPETIESPDLDDPWIQFLGARFAAPDGQVLDLNESDTFGTDLAAWLRQFDDDIELAGQRNEDWTVLNARCAFAARVDLNEKAVRRAKA